MEANENSPYPGTAAPVEDVVGAGVPDIGVVVVGVGVAGDDVEDPDAGKTQEPVPVCQHVNDQKTIRCGFITVRRVSKESFFAYLGLSWLSWQHPQNHSSFALDSFESSY